MKNKLQLWSLVYITLRNNNKTLYIIFTQLIDSKMYGYGVYTIPLVNAGNTNIITLTLTSIYFVWILLLCLG